MKWIITLTLCCLLPRAAWSADITLHIGNHNIQAVIADTPNSRSQGLMQKTELCKNCGMLFIFPIAGKPGFWMKDTPLPLSIAFISADGNILNIDEMQAYTTNNHSTHGNALYALEMNKNWFTEHAIKANDHVEGLPQTLQGK